MIKYVIDLEVLGLSESFERWFQFLILFLHHHLFQNIHVTFSIL